MGQEAPLKRPKRDTPSFPHTGAEDPIPRAPAHQRPEFLQHLFFHEYKHGGDFVSVPARRRNNEEGRDREGCQVRLSEESERASDEEE